MQICGQILSMQFWFEPISAPISWSPLSVRKTVISQQKEFWPILSFPLSRSQSPHTESEYALALYASQKEWILDCHNDSETDLSHFLS